jgi:membrane-associated protease RseP (regulator of RpoE activity)
VAKEGWAKVPEEERTGLSTPAVASPAYREWLEDVYRQHATVEGENDSDGLQSFIEAQLVRDRAFAEAIRDALLAEPDALVVGVVGTGHVEHGWGVPRQLASLGIDDVAVLLPWEKSSSCEDLTADIADAVFAVDSPPEPAQRPRLGVMLGDANPGVSVVEVLAGSVAETAGIRVGDVIIEAAGQTLEGVTDLQRIVGHLPANKPLSLQVQRDGKAIEIEADLSGEYP